MSKYIKLFEEFVNEEDELIFRPKDKEHGKKAEKVIDDSDFYAEYDETENYLSFGEEDNPDELEKEIQKIFNKEGIEGSFELQ